MEADPRDEVNESSEDDADAFDNYGVFQDDYEFKFVQEGNDKTTLMLPPVTYDSMEVKYFNVEIEVDSELHVSALEKEETTNGTTRFFFRIAKEKLHLDQTDEGYEQLGEDGYEYEELTDPAAEKAKKGKSKKTRTPMDAHNYSKPKVTMSSAPALEVKESPKKSEKMKKPGETKKVKVEALDGTQVDQDNSSLKESADADEEMDYEIEYIDDGDDDIDDFDETEIAENMTLGDSEEDEDVNTKVTPKRKAPKKAATTSERKRKYTRTNHYSKDSSNFTVELNDEGKLFRCNTCEYTSKWPGNMRDHLRVHTGEKPFKCKICGKCFANQTSQNKHMAVHSDERPHTCNICGFSFKLKRQLVKHYTRHMTPGSVKCPVCEKGFYSKAELNHHMPTHTGERKFKCNECNKTFTSGSSLGRHKMLHSGAKFECHICGHLAMRKEYWRAHLIKAHNIDENDELVAKRTRFRRLYDQEEPGSVPSVHTIRVVKTESVKTEPTENAEPQEVEGEQEIIQEMEEGQVQYIISLDY